MSGFAPFGRDDQPLLDVKIVGGKRVEITVDHYGRPLKGDTKPKVEEQSRFTRSLSEERNVKDFNPSQNSSVPPWIRGETPPKKVLKPIQVSPVSTRQSSRSSSRSSGIDAPVAPMVLPPIARQSSSDSYAKDHNKNSFTLLEELESKLQGLDTAKLKDAYLHFSGLDSTLTGFVDAGQVEQVFLRCKIPIDGNHLDALASKFMAARRPNWVNYEQMLKYINSLVRNEKRSEGRVPTLDFNSHFNTSGNQDITLKPNQVSPRSVNDGSITGRQSTILVKHAFQDRQDAQLLVEMERLLKKVSHLNELMWSLKDTLNDSDENGNSIISTQKIKTICLRHHLPFNGSLLDRIVDRFDPRGTGRVDWTEFIAFVERAMPLSTTNSPASSHNQSRQSTSHSSVDTPPTRPSWETRQPLQALSKRDQVIPKAAVLQQEEMYDEHKRLLDEQLKDQSQQLSEILHKQQRYIDKRQKGLQTDHIAEKLGQIPDETPEKQSISQDQADLEEKHRKLLQQQFALIEQKRKINEEQEELNKYVSDGRGSKEDLEDNPVKSFLRLAHALFLYDNSGSGFLEYDVIKRLIINYNLVYRLGFNSDVIEDAIDNSSTGEGMVSIDRLLDELKKNLVAA